MFKPKKDSAYQVILIITGFITIMAYIITIDLKVRKLKKQIQNTYLNNNKNMQHTRQINNYLKPRRTPSKLQNPQYNPLLTPEEIELLTR